MNLTRRAQPSDPTPGWWSTGIPVLNELLTRKSSDGLFKPGSDGNSSSITVIKGPIGTGKSILAAILASNLTTQAAFPIYLVFDQPAAGIAGYISTILERRRTADQPLILAPAGPRPMSREGGVLALRRMLSELLAKLIPSPFIDPRPKALFSWIDRTNDWVRAGRCTDDATAVDFAALTPVLFLDPINFFFEYRDSRSVVSELFHTIRNRKTTLITTLEDPGAMADLAHRQLASDVEFESDVVITLATRSAPHVRRTIEVVKNRHAPSVYGPHQYRIEEPTHSLSNLSDDEEPHPGFLIFPSIHRVLSQFSERHGCEPSHHSGILEVDNMLGEGLPGRPMLPDDATILVRGVKGAHKLSLAFNLLVGGLWCGAAGKDTSVLLLSFGEEAGIDVSNIALCGLDGEEKNNAHAIKSFQPAAHSAGPPAAAKALIHEWVAESPGYPGNHRLIVATFKPGHLSPEELLWIIAQLFKLHAPSRVLVNNTANLRMRFPELQGETMLFPAISSITHAKKCMLIVNDVGGRGSDENVSYGLAGMADYVATLTRITTDGKSGEEIASSAVAHALQSTVTSQGSEIATHKWSRLDLQNVRGKNYRQQPRFLTVASVGGRNRLFVLDRKGA